MKGLSRYLERYRAWKGAAVRLRGLNARANGEDEREFLTSAANFADNKSRSAMQEAAESFARDIVDRGLRLDENGVIEDSGHTTGPDGHYSH